MADDAAAAAAAGVLADMGLANTTAEAPALAGDTGEQPAPAVDLPDFTPDLAGIEDLIDVEDIPLDDIDDEEIDLDPIAETPVGTDEYVDPEVAQLRAQNEKLAKQVRYQQELRLKDGQKRWRDEAKRRFPLCDPDSLAGNSRRAVLREAAQQHAKTESLIKPYIQAARDVLAAEKQDARQEARQEAANAWGQPFVGPGEANAELVAVQEEKDKLDRRHFTNVHQIVAARIKQGFQI